MYNYNIKLLSFDDIAYTTQLNLNQPNYRNFEGTYMKQRKLIIGM